MGNRYILSKKKKKTAKRRNTEENSTTPGKPTLSFLTLLPTHDNDEAPPLAETVTGKKVIIISYDQGSKGKQRPRRAQFGEAKQRGRGGHAGEEGQRRTYLSENSTRRMRRGSG